ncbi:hypothetical protein L249_1968 [Ophiocordyceps polyrhachis-furcata BCC 54312]|uniref:thioredoxin-dependent peroxiredoxin n=1 Tax=Ophiocordyceps polyrhachis-furcata BCC 54312 TaxID=1330021 RepID=A0A367LRB5_9HYPO|nr:hypothetical protein L249_1968 [Ophiocordyceps polyrhachis-furcata BCC 54312]
MPVELRKRKAPQPPPAPAPTTKKQPTTKKKKTTASSKSAAPLSKEAESESDPAPQKEEEKEKDEEKGKEEEEEEREKETKKTQKKTKVAVGDVLDLDDNFGGEIEDQDGQKTTLKQLIQDCKTGVVIFTYPKASTPGCTVQACLFRDAYDPVKAAGLSIYGLSNDKPKANTTFKEKQKLQYPLLCDPHATLIDALGFKKHPKGTQRGVFVVDANRKVLVCQQGAPAATVDRVKQLVREMNG